MYKINLEHTDEPESKEIIKTFGVMPKEFRANLKGLSLCKMVHFELKKKINDNDIKMMLPIC